MTDNNIILKTKDLSKRYKIYPGPWHRLFEWFTFGRRQYHKIFWAVKDVSFELRKGEFLAIIGPNGAGKSTLLKIITEVTVQTGGEFEVNGRVLSILELSGGMDLSLTGRENVIRSGQLLGFPDGYVKERMEHIKEFSEIEDFFEQPLHTYSTGMRTRLSFAMFAFLDCDVLILDEVLAVGDIFFKQKCFARLEELISRNTSIILVTHSMGVVQRYCSRAILLNKGSLIYDGETSKAINMFMHLRGERGIPELQDSLQEEIDEVELELGPSKSRLPINHISTNHNEAAWPPDSAFTLHSFPKIKGKGRARLIRLAILNDAGEPNLIFRQGDQLHLYLEYELMMDIEMPVTRVEIRDKFNSLIHSKDSQQTNTKVPSSLSKGHIIRWHQTLKLNLAPNNYIFNIELFSMKSSSPSTQKIAKLSRQETRLSRLDQAFAIVLTHYNQENLDLLHGGLVDLPGTIDASFFASNHQDTAQ